MSRFRNRLAARNLWKSERGDTIVEVMISLIVISAILTGAFLVSRTSSRDIRGSQEHSEALQLLQGQVEMLRSLAATDSSQFSTQTGKFCVKAQPDNTLKAVTTGCSVSHANYSYDLAIQRETAQSLTQGPTYRFTAQWEALGGGTSKESIVYRLTILN